MTIIIDREVEVDANGIAISKTNYRPFTGGALKLAAAVGFLYPWEVLVLQVFTRGLSLNAVIVNIGAGAGTSSLAMTEARMDLIKSIYSIDIEGIDNPRGSLVGEQHAFAQYNTPLINQILGDSYDVGMAWDKGSVDMVFVDGDHSAKSVGRDIQAWLFHIKDGGFMLFHDYNNRVFHVLKPVIDRMMADHELIMIVDTVAVYRIHKPIKKGRKPNVRVE